MFYINNLGLKGSDPFLRFNDNSILAYKYLGYGLHAVMDSMSPAHVGFQYWDEDDESIKERHGPDFFGAGIFNLHPETTLEAITQAEKGGHTAPVVAAMRTYLDLEKCSCEK